VLGLVKFRREGCLGVESVFAVWVVGSMIRYLLAPYPRSIHGMLASLARLECNTGYSPVGEGVVTIECSLLTGHFLS
jgi:hypothetical protein